MHQCGNNCFNISKLNYHLGIMHPASILRVSIKLSQPQLPKCRDMHNFAYIWVLPKLALHFVCFVISCHNVAVHWRSKACLLLATWTLVTREIKREMTWMLLFYDLRTGIASIGGTLRSVTFFKAETPWIITNNFTQTYLSKRQMLGFPNGWLKTLTSHT